MKKPQPRLKPIHAGWVFYDDDCGLCRRLAKFGKKRLLKSGLCAVPLSEPWVKQKLRCSELALRSDLHLLLDDGNVLKGANAYRYMFQHIGWAYPLYLFSILPLGSSFFNWTYRKVADNRRRFSRSCNVVKPS